MFQFNIMSGSIGKADASCSGGIGVRYLRGIGVRFVLCKWSSYIMYSPVKGGVKGQSIGSAVSDVIVCGWLESTATGVSH